MNDIFKKAQNAFFVKRDNDLAIKLLENKTSQETKVLLALIYFDKSEYTKASLLYEDLNFHAQHAYCQFLLGNLSKARELYQNLASSPFKEWFRFLLEVVVLDVKTIPTFLQIRHFFEIDLTNLLNAQKLEFAENLISAEDFLADINPEVYKFIGRVFLNSNFSNLCVKYLTKSLELVPNDPEVYYYLANYSYRVKAYNEAKRMISECKRIQNSYTPAQLLLEKINDLEQIS
jgi:tetratricopeptide (TPR) repeat protein